MPIKSQAQRRKFAELLTTGKISAEVFERWNREAGGAELPERVRPKRRVTRKKKRVRRVSGTSTRRRSKAKRRS
jgi:hypothetical protein